MPIKYAIIYYYSEPSYFVKYTMLIKYFTFLRINVNNNSFIYFPTIV